MRSTRSSLQVEHVKHAGCQHWLGPAREANTTISPPLMFSPHWRGKMYKQSASNSHLLQHKTLGSNTYVFTGRMKHRPWQQFQSSSPEGFFLSLHAKHVKLLLLFFAERLAVSHLREMFKTCLLSNYSERSPCGPHASFKKHAGFLSKEKSIDGELEKVLMELDKYKCIKCVLREWKETENQPGI